jgi:hypothetical protein
VHQPPRIGQAAAAVTFSRIEFSARTGVAGDAPRTHAVAPSRAVATWNASCRVTFTSVLDAIQGDGFNPLWQEVQIVFLTTQQFFSDNEILTSAAAGQIKLAPTMEVDRCSVVGTK